MSAAIEPLIRVRNLCIEFDTEVGIVRAVDDISFDVYPGETMGVVGESGCGKTVTALALLRLIPSSGRIAAGSIEMDGQDLATLPEKAMRDIRGGQISMIFQEPMTALNPVFTCGNQMTDVLVQHKGLTRNQARTEAVEMLGRVGIPRPDKRVDDYPHQLSGGMRQRVMIAMALSCNPKVLVADEPTTALDVTTQAQVMEQIVKLQEEFGMAVVLITHDLGVVAESCRRAVVMYCGKVIEDAPIETLFATPRHPYTAGLLRSIPRIRERRIAELPIIPGMVPDLRRLPAGCRFAPRCERATEVCAEQLPPLRDHDGGARAACHHPVHDTRRPQGTTS